VQNTIISPELLVHWLTEYTGLHCILAYWPSLLEGPKIEEEMLIQDEGHNIHYNIGEIPE